MKITDQQLVELIDFSPSLDFKAKVRWRGYVSHLSPDERERLFKSLSDEKREITEVLQKKMKGFRGYFFAKNLESLEGEFMHQQK